jgi:hypothetical protein
MNECIENGLERKTSNIAENLSKIRIGSDLNIELTTS